MITEVLYTADNTQGSKNRGLLKSTSGPSNFTRLQLIGPVLKKLCVCLDKRDTHKSIWYRLHIIPFDGSMILAIPKLKEESKIDNAV